MSHVPALRLVSSPAPSGGLSELRLAVKEYLISAQQQGLLSRTLKHYEWHLDRLVKWLAARGVTRPADLTRLLVREWGASLYEPYTPPGRPGDEVKPGVGRTWGLSVIKQATTAARSFLRWCASEGYCADDLVEVLKTPKVKKRQQRTLSRAEVGKLHAVCDLSRDKGKRDRALLGLLLDSGLRAAEVCRVEANGVEFGVVIGDQKVNRVKVVIKGGNEEYGHFSDQTAEYIREWQQVRQAVPGVRALFVSIGGSTPGHALTTTGLGKILKYLGEQAGIEHVSPHVFRRTFAVMLTELGVPSRAVQLLGRWSDIRMVEHYTAGLVAGRIFSQYSGHLWG